MKNLMVRALLIAFIVYSLQIPMLGRAVTGEEENEDIFLLLNYQYASVNGKRVKLDKESDVTPFTYNDRTLVPLRFLSESMGAEVDYNESTQEIAINFASNTIKLLVNSQDISVDGKIKKIDAPAIVQYDRVFVPLRAISEITGKQVFWDESGIIVISDRTWDQTIFNEAQTQILSGLGLVQAADPAKERGKMTDMQLIKSRICNTMYSKSIDVGPIMLHMKEDGSFDDINYRDNTPDQWAIAKHLDNLLALGKAYNSIGNKYYHNKEVKQKYILGLINWVENDYMNTANLWWQSLGTPPKMADILLMKVPEIPEEVLKKAFDICARGDIRIAYTRSHAGKEALATGGNLTNSCTISLKMAVAEENDEFLKEVLRELEKEILVFTPPGFTQEGEGLKVDYSFHQHLPLLYNALYGNNFMVQISAIIGWLQGTKYMLSDRSVKEYTNFLLDGQQWMFRGVNDDLNAVGRGIAQITNSTYIGKNILAPVKTLLALPNVSRRSELIALLNNRLLVNDKGFIGNKHFWTSDYISHNRNTFHIGVRSTSARTKPSEQINGENLLGYYLGDGVTMIQRTGSEYSGTGPVWDWNKIPGTTTPQGALKPLTFSTWVWKGATDFAGGVSDGIYGASCMDYNKDGLSAKKSWFMFDEGMVALGAGIAYSGEFPVNTAINQCGLKGNVEMSNGKNITTIEKGTKKLDNVSWVLHDGVGYLFPEKQSVMLKNDAQTGKMSDISQYASTGQMKLDMFNMWIDHGSRVNVAKYAYMVLPEITSKELNEYAASSPLQIVKNEPDVQAVWHKTAKVLEVVFWKEGSVTTGDGLTVSVDKPCALLVQDRGDCTELAVSNPMSQKAVVTVTVNREISSQWAAKSGKNSSVIFNLPEGNYAGKTLLFDSQRGFWKDDYNRYNELNQEDKKPALMGITLNGEPLEGFKPEITGYKIPLAIDNTAIPNVKAFGQGIVEITNDDSASDKVLINISNKEKPEASAIYTVSFYVPPKEGEPDNAVNLKVEGVKASDVPQPENKPENTIDGIVSDNSRWSATGDPVWIQYDLGGTKNVDYIALAVAFGDTRTTSFSISTSMDGEKWSEVYNGLTSGTTNNLETYPIKPSQARYVRVYGRGSSISPWTSITEVKMYSKSGS